MQAVHTPEHVTGRKHARWAACLPEASNATVTRPKSGRLRGRHCCGWARVHPFSPAPYRIVPASAFCALLPWATVSVIKIKTEIRRKKKEKEWQFTAQGLAVFFPLYYSSYPAASEASMAAVWSLNATGLGLPGCITVFVASLWGGVESPLLASFLLGSEHPDFPTLSEDMQRRPSAGSTSRRCSLLQHQFLTLLFIFLQSY